MACTTCNCMWFSAHPPPGMDAGAHEPTSRSAVHQVLQDELLSHPEAIH